MEHYHYWITILLLMIILNFIFFTPLTKVIEDREIYVNEILEQASTKLTKANQLTNNYNSQLAKFLKEINTNLVLIIKLYKENLEIENKNSQESIDEFLEKVTKNFDKEKISILSNLQDEINILSKQILLKIVT